MDFFTSLQSLDSLTIVKIILFGLSFGLGMYYARYTKAFGHWIKGGIENGDGILENKDLQIASFTVFCGFILITIAFWQVNWPEAVIYSVFGTTAALFGIKNIGQSYVDSRKNKPNDDSDI